MPILIPLWLDRGRRKRFAVMMEAGNDPNVSGGRYSRLLENPFGQRAVQTLGHGEGGFFSQPLKGSYLGMNGLYDSI